jgi:hypothetical protein
VKPYLESEGYLMVQKRKGTDHNLTFLLLFNVDIFNFYIKQKIKVSSPFGVWACTLGKPLRGCRASITFLFMHPLHPREIQGAGFGNTRGCRGCMKRKGTA